MASKPHGSLSEEADDAVALGSAAGVGSAGLVCEVDAAFAGSEAEPEEDDAPGGAAVD